MKKENGTVIIYALFLVTFSLFLITLSFKGMSRLGKLTTLKTLLNREDYTIEERVFETIQSGSAAQSNSIPRLQKIQMSNKEFYFLEENSGKLMSLD